MNSPPITVLMPAFNSGPYLEAAIKSILTQTYINFELLIINDGSTDDTPKILNRYRKLDARIKLVNHPHRLGLVKTLNQGLKLASGTYIARMDADDISLPTRLSQQLKYLHINPKIAIVGSNVRVINATGKQIGTWYYPAFSKCLKWYMLFKCPFAHPSVMYVKKAILKLGGYPSNCPHCEDHALWLKVMCHYQGANVQKSLLLYRSHPRSITARHRITSKQIIFNHIYHQARNYLKINKTTYSQILNHHNHQALLALYNAFSKSEKLTKLESLIIRQLYFSPSRRTSLVKPILANLINFTGLV